jgi:putative peptide zinc metalloprotease protein
VPQRAERIELIGEFEESGFEDDPFIVRRGDGQVVQLTELLYLTLDAVDGRRDLESIAAEVSRHLGRTATAENVSFLLDEKLRPMGLLKGPDGDEPKVEKSNPLLALRWRFVLSSERLTNRLTAPFAHLFHRPIVALVIAAFVGVSAWVLLVRGLAQGMRQALYSPGLLILIFVLTIVSAGFHEFGHAAACRYGGARPGVMGAGIYLVWPAFYTDVTDAYRLGRGGRLRTDLGGLYFNAIFLLGVVGAWAVTGYEAFLLAVPLQLFQMLHQLLPFVRMDGYYILSDLTGVPDLFARIKPTLKSAVPGAETDERAARLKRWVRVVVTAWVLVVVPLLLFSAALAAITLPRLAATAWDSLGLQSDAISDAAGDGRWLSVGGGILSIVALLLPVASTTYLLCRVARRVGRRAWHLTEGRAPLRAAGGLVLVAALAGLAWLWWPNGEYRPLQKGERGTVVDGFKAAAELPTGRPGLTEERADELNGAPSARDGEAVDAVEPDAPTEQVDSTTADSTTSTTSGGTTTTEAPTTSTTDAPSTTTTEDPTTETTT